MSKILIVGPAYPLRGGLATYDERLCAEFRSQGHECEILSFSLQYPAFLFPGKTQLSSDPPPAGIPVLPWINSINPLNWIRTGIRMRRREYDLVVFRYWMSFMAPAFGTIARLMRGKKTRIIAITDNIVPHEKRFFDSLFTRWFVRACDGFLTMSQSVLDQVEQLCPGKPALYVPHPMYDMFGPAVGKLEARAQLGLNPDGRYLLFFGFIRRYKGLHLLLDALADERLKQMDVRLIVAGEFYEDSAPYIQQINDLGISGRVTMSNDFIPNSGVSPYFCACDLVVQTYLSATQSGVTQIAYYYDKPMVVTRVGGLAELVPDGKAGFVVNPDKMEVADAIVRFYSESREHAFTENVKIEKQRFTWGNLSARLLSLQQKVQ